MKICLSNDEMRDSDKYTINDLGIPSLTLMERAGTSIADETEKVLRSASNKTVAVVCGGGNNGGDGFCAARRLKESGYDVTVVCSEEELSPDCDKMKRRYFGKTTDKLAPGYGVIVDCLFGTGLSREVDGKNAEMIEAINESGAFVVSADIPSGLNGDNGLVMGTCVKANLTVTIGQYKNGLFLNDGRDLCGKIVLADIGIVPAREYGFIWEEEDSSQLFPSRYSNTNKGDYGKAVIIAGSEAYSGAAMLCASACIKTGAGYTSLCLPSEVFKCAMGKIPELLLVKGKGRTDYRYDERQLYGFLKASAIVVGPGLGVSSAVYKMICYLLDNYKGTLLLDADALNTLSQFGVGALKGAKAKVLITPHVKEFSRLVGSSVKDVENDVIFFAEEFADEYGVTVLLKSNTSVITDGKRTALCIEGTPALAKGGSGDVLAGITAALLAQGNDAFSSACTASFLLGRAGKIAEENGSEYSVSASDLVSSIAKAIRSLSGRIA